MAITNGDKGMEKEQQPLAEGLVFIGKVVELTDITGADFIGSATVVCGSGGRWRGVVKKEDFTVGSLCIVYLPDALIPEREDMAFMKGSNWRVKMRRFKGAPSEVVITKTGIGYGDCMVGMDVTAIFEVTKYNKPVPSHLSGMAIGNFPSFIPKTDEPNYQRNPDLVQELVGKPYYISEKADGSSTTAYRYKGHFGLCSRNLELLRDENNGYWKMAIKYQLEDLMPEGYALQFETCGPSIQGNPMGFKSIEARAFSGFNITEQRYLTQRELYLVCEALNFPICKVVGAGDEFSTEGIELLGEGVYSNGKQREGVVVRSKENLGCAPVSFKVINLNYER